MNPTGNITFFDGDSAIRGCASIALGTGGTPADAAQCSTGTLLPATHSITAAYTGDVANAPSLSAVLSQVVNAAPGAPSGSGGSSSSSSGAGAPPPVDLGSPSTRSVSRACASARGYCGCASTTPAAGRWTRWWPRAGLAPKRRGCARARIG